MVRSASKVFSLAAILTCLAVPAWSETGPKLRAQKILDGWNSWVERHAISQAAIAISFEGKLIASAGTGIKADTPAPIASVSKAITGACITKLIETGKLSFETRLEDVIPELPSGVSVSRLLTHTSGYTKDVTQRPLAYKGREKEYLEWISASELRSGRLKSHIGSFHYNNANYAMLGAIIRSKTGKSYEAACKELVLSPIGVTNAFLNPKWRIMSSWGGWMISATDHLRFVNAYFSKSQAMNSAPLDLPNFKFDNPLRYGMGYLFRDGRNGGFNFWHDGRWDFQHDQEKDQFGAFFVSFDNGWAISINHNISALNGEHAEIDRFFAQATHQPL